MKKLIGRIKLMNIRFKKNPITANNRVKAMYKYIYFNMVCRIKKEIHHKGIGGLNFSIQKGDSGLVGNIYYGVYEFNESMFMTHFLRQEDTFLDIGANLGHYSLLASGLTGAKSIAIEPIPSTFKKLQKQININNLNNSIEANNIGLSKTKANLYFSNDSEDMNHIVDEHYRNAIEVPVDTLDNITKKTLVRLIKIDVEGYEKVVFEGGPNTLRNKELKAMIVELNDSGKRYNISDDELYEMIISYGFLPYEYYPISRQLVSLESYNKKQFNTIFIKDIDFVKERIDSSIKYKIWDKEV